jgi:hypothetical protein
MTDAERFRILDVYTDDPARSEWKWGPPGYFQPSFTTAAGSRGQPKTGPILTPCKIFEWSLVYDPAANGGSGEMRVTLGKESVALTLTKGQRAEGARFDRFGLFNSKIGGQLVRIYLDDLQYTAGRPNP